MPPGRGADVVRIALAGAGRGAPLTALAAASVRGVSVVAVAPPLGQEADDDPTVDRAGRELAAALDVPYGPLATAGHDVVIASPCVPGRARAAVAAAARGPVVLDGPLAATMSEADQLVAAAADLPLGYGEPLAHSPALGPVLGELAGLGPLAHLEVHAEIDADAHGSAPVDLLDDPGAAAVALCLLAAAPARAVTVTRPEGAPAGRWELTFDSGLHAALVLGHATTPVLALQAAAPGGAVRLELLPDAVLERDGRARRLPAVPRGVPARLEALGHRHRLAALAAAGRDPWTPPVPVTFGRAVAAVLDAAARAAAAPTLAAPVAGARAPS